MMIELNFDDLRDTFPRLYRTVSSTFGHTSGTHTVNVAKLSDFSRGELSAWFRTQKPPAPQPAVEPAEPVTPVAPVVILKHADPEPIKEAMDISKNEERRQIEKQAEDADAFEKRLLEYEQAGLEPTKENANAIVDWIKQHPQLKGYFSVQAADLAVQWLGPKGSNVLKFRKPQVEPPPAPAEPEEFLGTLPDGSKQLSLDTQPSKHHTKEQVKDWLARTREVTGKYLRPRGSFGSSL